MVHLKIDYSFLQNKQCCKDEMANSVVKEVHHSMVLLVQLPGAGF